MRRRFDLAIFDVDGTLVRPKTGGEFRQSADDWEFIPGRREAVQRILDAGCAVALATNQGGVAFGYYTEGQMLEQMDAVMGAIAQGKPDARIRCLVEFSHPQAKLPRYRKESGRRKPGGDMLREAMAWASVRPGRTVMTGDRHEDYCAALNADVSFCYADEFFDDVDAVIFNTGDVVPCATAG